MAGTLEIVDPKVPLYPRAERIFKVGLLASFEPKSCLYETMFLNPQVSPYRFVGLIDTAFSMKNARNRMSVWRCYCCRSIKCSASGVPVTVRAGIYFVPQQLVLTAPTSGKVICGSNGEGCG